MGDRLGPGQILVTELAPPAPNGPRNIEAAARRTDRIHVAVIGDGRKGVDPDDRCATILDAHQQRAVGDCRIPQTSPAPDLIQAEAKRLGVA